MPSPCEVTPEQVPAVELMMLESPTPLVARITPAKVIPAVAGGAFAGLLLIVLGCTPLFKPASAKAETQQATIVKARSDGTVKRSTASVTAPAKTKAMTIASTSASPSTSAGGVATLAAASSKRGGVASSSEAAHSFTIDCNPAHANEDALAARPENVALQGIMAGQSSKAALLDGVLYREGDRFGSHVCPWTIAMIDAASVRIEKAFGDRTCGVTIRFQQDAAARSRTSR